jgi:hypothetical protein
MAVLDDTTTADLIKNWFERQYVTEVQTRYSLATSKPGRLSMIYMWRIQPDVSLWKALPDEEPPTSWPRKPLLASLNKQAREAWGRCDRGKAKELYYMWTHACDNPYYCPCHGIGSD